jgi:hypothetical protein
LRALFLTAITLLAVVTSSCSSEDADAPPTDGDVLEYELFPNTILLDAAALASLEPETERGTLVFAGPPKALANVEPHNVLLAGQSDGTPDGLLRFVLEVEHQPGKVILHTVDAPIQLAFRRLKARLKREIPSIRDMPGAWPPHQPLSTHGPWDGPGLRPTWDVLTDDVEEVVSVDFYPYDGDGNTSTTNDQVHVRGELRGGFVYTVAIDIDWGALDDVTGEIKDCLLGFLKLQGCDIEDMLPEAVVRLDVDSHLEAGVGVEGIAYKGFDYPIELPLGPKVVATVGPLVLTGQLKFHGGASGRASSRFKVATAAGLNLAGSITAGSSSSPKVEGFIPDPYFTAPITEVNLQASAKAEAGVRLYIKAYDIVGGWVGLEAFALLEGDQLRQPCWTLHGGLQSSAGFIAELDAGSLGRFVLAEAGWSHPVVQELVASGNCALPPDDGPIEPGSGPTSETFLKPGFTPWSTTYTADALRYPHVDAQGLRWSDIVQTIDGNYVLTSSEGHALIKTTQQGELVWSKTYWREDRMKPGDPPLFPVRVATAADATMLVATHPYGLMKVGQAGGVAWARSFELPEHEGASPYGSQSDQHRFAGSAEDGQGGMLIVGTHVPDAATRRAAGMVVGFDTDGSVTRSQLISDAQESVYPTVILPTEAGTFVAGYLWNETELRKTGFAVMLKPDGSVVWAQRFSGCSEASEARPTTALVHSSGDIVLAGTIGTYLRSFIIRMDTAGAHRFRAMPWTGSDLSYLAINDIEELPTTGYLVAGRYTNAYDPDDTFLAAFDVAGNPMWMTRYLLESKDPTLPAHSAFPSLWLSDDGGAMLLSHASYRGSGNASYWLLKAFARDGTVSFGSEATAQSGTVELADSCAIAPASWSPIVADLAMDAQERSVIVETAPFSEQTQ